MRRDNKGPVHTEWSKPLQTCIQYKFWIFKKFCTTLTASNLHDMQNQIKEKKQALPIFIRGPSRFCIRVLDSNKIFSSVASI